MNSDRVRRFPSVAAIIGGGFFLVTFLIGYAASVPSGSGEHAIGLADWMLLPLRIPIGALINFLVLIGFHSALELGHPRFTYPIPLVPALNGVLAWVISSLFGFLKNTLMKRRGKRGHRGHDNTCGRNVID
jgi:hypothetical protein